MTDPATRAGSARRRDRATPLRREGAGRGVLPKYPVTRGRRWLLRVALSLPFVLLTVVLAAGGSDYFLHDSANAALVEHVVGLRGEALDVDLLVALYPPVSTLLALVIPGGVVGLGIVAGLVNGFLLQRVVEWFHRRRLSPAERLLLVLLLAGTPLFAFLSTTNLEISLGLALFLLGMIDLVRFVTFANTQAGFRVGIYFAVAALTAPAFLFSIVIAGCVTPFLRRSRRGAGIANTLVLVFPTLAAFGSVALLGLVFRGDALFLSGSEGLRIHPDRVQLLSDLLAPPWGWLFFVPTVLGMLLALCLRELPLMIVAPLLTGSVLLMSVLGVTPRGSAGLSLLTLVAVLVALAPRGRGRLQRALIGILGVVQIVVGWLSAVLLYPSVRAWTEAVSEGWWGR